jgi:tetratricopeptide (TPR) repeat protein
MDDFTLPQMIEKAKSAYEAEDFDEAARWYDRAGSQYSLQDDTLNVAEMANNRSVCLLRGGNSQAALAASRGTEKVFAQAGDLRRQAMALGNQAAAFESMQKIDDAITLYLQSNDLLKQIDDHDLRMFVLQSLSGLQLKKRRYLQALATMQAALDIKQNLTLREKILKKLLQIVFSLLGR